MLRRIEVETLDMKSRMEEETLDMMSRMRRKPCI